jgi:hypothetical protein
VIISILAKFVQVDISSTLRINAPVVELVALNVPVLSLVIPANGDTPNKLMEHAKNRVLLLKLWELLDSSL